MSDQELPEPQQTFPVIEVPTIDHTDDSAVMTETQRIRMTAAKDLLSSPLTMQDPKMANVLIKLIDGADKQALTRRRVEAMERSNEVSSDLATTLDAYVSKIANGVRRHDGPSDGAYRPQIPDIPACEVKPGELDPVGKEINVEKIIQSSLDKLRSNVEDQD